MIYDISFDLMIWYDLALGPRDNQYEYQFSPFNWFLGWQIFFEWMNEWKDFLQAELVGRFKFDWWIVVNWT